uniref:Protein kinase domain-containing protein n=1 Tax=Branchiostoma floridae TaxID=7739 RepID=C3YK92_BRAFL|eukprot:XP_002603242.1 hypothetical protein BRAFLDRAFT_93306 [Branchiostoma floridae]
MKSLPDYIEYKQFPGTPLKDIFTAAADDLISLLGKLLCLNPSQRYNCSQVSVSTPHRDITVLRLWIRILNICHGLHTSIKMVLFGRLSFLISFIIFVYLK